MADNAQVRRLAPGRGGEAVRQRPAVGASELNDLVDDVFTAAGRVPHRPLPRQGDGPEHPGAALRQHAVRAGVERATTSTRCRSPWPRTSASAPGPASTTPPAPPATCCRTTCCSCSRWSAMEEPTSFDADDDPHREAQGAPGDHAARGHRDRHASAGSTCRAGSAGERAVGYLEEEDVPPDSTTETYVGGPARRPEPALGRGAVLPAHRQAAAAPGHRDRDHVQEGAAPAVQPRPTSRCSGNNQLVIRVQPDEGVTLKFGSKVPGHDDGGPRHRDGLPVRRGVHRVVSPEAYERLVLDVLIGDRDAVPGRRRGRAVLAGHRPAGGVLGRHQAGARTAPASGDRAAADEMLARDGPAPGGRAMIGARSLWDTTGNEVVKALAAERRSAGGVASGLALTLVVVVDEKRRRARPRRPRRPRPPRTRAGCSSWSGADVGAPTTGSTPRSWSAAGSAPARPSSCGCTAGWRCTPSRSCMPLLAPDVPVVTWWHGEPPERHRQRLARRGRRPADHRLRAGARPDRGAAAAGRGLRARRHRPGLDPDHAVARAARRRRSTTCRRPRPSAEVQAEPRQPERRADRRLAAGPARHPRSGEPTSDGPGITAVELRFERRRRAAIDRPGRRLGDAVAHRPARPQLPLQAARPRRPARRGAAPARRRPALRRGAGGRHRRDRASTTGRPMRTHVWKDPARVRPQAAAAAKARRPRRRPPRRRTKKATAKKTPPTKQDRRRRRPRPRKAGRGAGS